MLRFQFQDWHSSEIYWGTENEILLNEIQADLYFLTVVKVISDKFVIFAFDSLAVKLDMVGFKESTIFYC